jgi:hypothetical protein
VQLRSAKLETPELGNFFPELLSVIAKSTRQRPLCRRPLSAKRPHFVFCFFAFHIDTHTHTVYLYSIPDLTRALARPPLAPAGARFFSSGFSLPFSPPPRSCGFPALLLLFFNLRCCSFFLCRPLSSSHWRRRFRPSSPPPPPYPPAPLTFDSSPLPQAPSLPGPSPSFSSTPRSSCLAAPGPIPPGSSLSFPSTPHSSCPAVPGPIPPWPLAVVPIQTPQLVPPSFYCSRYPAPARRPVLSPPPRLPSRRHATLPGTGVHPHLLPPPPDRDFGPLIPIGLCIL